jgi:hypothetical protein
MDFFYKRSRNLFVPLVIQFKRLTSSTGSASATVSTTSKTARESIKIKNQNIKEKNSSTNTFWTDLKGFINKHPFLSLIIIFGVVQGVL